MLSKADKNIWALRMKSALLNMSGRLDEVVYHVIVHPRFRLFCSYCRYVKHRNFISRLKTRLRNLLANKREPCYCGHPTDCPQHFEADRKLDWIKSPRCPIFSRKEI